MLHGDLVLRGGGDPTLGGRYDEESASVIFARWAGVLRARGLRRVTGDVDGDDSFFGPPYRHPSWGRHPAWKWYFTNASGLSINDNCVVVEVRPGGRAGAALVAALRREPPQSSGRLLP